ncbi:MAG: hypothetical protein IJC34_02540, partial [Lentisphaeria bacterium]|nr:hypothetical protein [Lentisphaeria bacterium]
SVYDKRIYNGYGNPEPEHELKMGPNIKDWPSQPELSEDLRMRMPLKPDTASVPPGWFGNFLSPALPKRRHRMIS